MEILLFYGTARGSSDRNKKWSVWRVAVSETVQMWVRLTISADFSRTYTLLQLVLRIYRWIISGRLIFSVSNPHSIPKMRFLSRLSQESIEHRRATYNHTLPEGRTLAFTYNYNMKSFSRLNPFAWQLSHMKPAALCELELSCRVSRKPCTQSVKTVEYRRAGLCPLDMYMHIKVGTVHVSVAIPADIIT